MNISIPSINDEQLKNAKAIIRVIISWGVAFITLMIFEHFFAKESSLIIAIGCIVSVVFAYGYYIYSLHSQYKDIQSSQLASLIFLYIIVGALIITFYTFYYAFFDLIGSSGSIVWEGNIAQATYFSIVTFTTLGFGEFIPKNDVARYIVSSEAILGTLHMVTFVSLWLSKLNKNNS